MDVRQEEAITTMIGMTGMTQEEAKVAYAEIQSEATISGIAKQIAEQRGVSLKYAYELARNAQEQEPAPAGMSTKDHILEALYRLNSNAGVSPETILSTLKSMGVKTNIQELNALLWDNQKLQFVKFNESHGGGGSILSRIRLTPRGRARIVQKRGTPQQAVIRVNSKAIRERGSSQNNRHGATHQAGIDPTYYRNHRKVAEGGPIEIIRPGDKPKQPEILPAIEYKAPKLGDPLPQNMKAPFEAPVEVVTPSTMKALEEQTAGIGATVEEAFGPVRQIDLKAYPLLEDLLRKRTKKEADKAKAETMLSAAAMIAEIDPAESDKLTAKAAELEGPAFSNLERDMLRFIDEVLGETK